MFSSKKKKKERVELTTDNFEFVTHLNLKVRIGHWQLFATANFSNCFLFGGVLVVGEEGAQEQRGVLRSKSNQKIEEKVPLEIAIKIQIQKRTHPFLTNWQIFLST